MLFQKGQPHDIAMLCGFCHGLAAQVPQSDTYVNTLAIQDLIYNLYTGFPHPAGLVRASPFKKAAAFLCYWVNNKPLLMQPDPFAHVNVKFGLHMALWSLEDATLTMNGTTHTIHNPLQLSEHSLLDIVHALARCEKPMDAFLFVSVLLEQLAYKTNPHCQYPDVLH